MKNTIALNFCKTIMVMLILVMALPLLAAETGQINYQARLLDSYGRRVNAIVDLSFKIYDSSNNVLWSETQSDITVQDGVYSVILGSQTPVPASVFTQNDIYLELGINGETMTPRQQITASAYALVARSVMGSNIFENQTSGNVGIGTVSPAAKLDVNGTLQTTGFKMLTGASSGYLLVSDSDGVGRWQPFSQVVVESDPIHTNWIRVVYTPATNSIWSAIGTEAATRAAADAVLQGNIDTSSNALSTAVGLRMFRSGDIMTGPLSNSAFFGGFYGDGGGLTNISSSGVSLTGVVHKVGDNMTGQLNVSNNVIVARTNEAGYLVATNSISLNGSVITNWNGLTASLNPYYISTAGGAVTNQNVAAGAISNVNISVAAVTSTNIVAGGISNYNIANDAVTADKIAGGAVIAGKLYGNAVVESNIANDAVTEIKIVDGAVTTNKIGPESVTSAKIKLAAVTADKIAGGAVTEGKLYGDAVVSSNIAGGAVTVGKLYGSAVVGSNIAPGAITSGKIAANAVADSNIASAVMWNNAVIIKDGNPGDTIAYSNLYYFAPGIVWSNANATTNTTAQGLLGLALGDSIPNNGLLLNGFFSNVWGFAAGSIIYMDTNNNKITTVKPNGTNNIVRILGYAINTTNIYFNPDRTYIELLGE